MKTSKLVSIGIIVLVIGLIAALVLPIYNGNVSERINNDSLKVANDSLLMANDSLLKTVDTLTVKKDILKMVIDTTKKK